MFSPTPQPHHTTEQHKRRQMELTIKDCSNNLYVIEVGVDDTTETMRQKVATAAGLAEDSFHMGFGGKQEGEDITQLSAGDTVVLTKTKKVWRTVCNAAPKACLRRSSVVAIEREVHGWGSILLRRRTPPQKLGAGGHYHSSSGLNRRHLRMLATGTMSTCVQGTHP